MGRTDELGLQPTVFYRWQKDFFENGAAAFQTRGRSSQQPQQERIAYLEKKIQRKDEVLAELMGEHIALKKVLGNSDQDLGAARRAGSDRGFRAALVGGQRDRRRAVRRMVGRDGEQVLRLATALRPRQRAQGLGSLGLLAADWEKQAILAFHLNNPLEGYRRLTFMMLDADVVAVSPASVWRLLSGAGLLRKWNAKPSKKGTGFEQPPEPHQHWHVDVSYINIAGTFYYLCSVLDGYSRAIVEWDLASR